MSRWTKEAIEVALVDANTYGDVLAKLGLKSIGRNNKTLQKYLKEFGLEFTPRPHLNRNYELSRTLTDEELFVENSPTARGVVRRRILKDKLIPYKCACCGCDPEWNGKPLALQLEHKNGVNDDHRLSNLEFLCPNCHSQTPTWAGRNSKQ